MYNDKKEEFAELVLKEQSRKCGVRNRSPGRALVIFTAWSCLAAALYGLSVAIVVDYFFLIFRTAVIIILGQILSFTGLNSPTVPMLLLLPGLFLQLMALFMRAVLAVPAVRFWFKAKEEWWFPYEYLLSTNEEFPPYTPETENTADDQALNKPNLAAQTA